MKKYFLIALVFAACTHPDRSGRQHAYIDLHALADSLQNAWSHDEPGRYEKYAKIDGEEERLQLQQYTFEAELDMIREFDINKYSAPGYYQRFLSPRPGAFIYAALDSTLQVKHLLEQRQPDGRLLLVEAYKSKSTFFYERSSSFQLFPDSMLEIHFRQKIKLPWSKPHEYLYRISRKRN